MSCRIERPATAAGPVVLRVSGHLESEHIKTIQTLIAQEAGPVDLDLNELMLADREAVSYLALCERKGIGLKCCPPFLREWIAQSGPATA